jgi:hypothetical protein
MLENIFYIAKWGYFKSGALIKSIKLCFYVVKKIN